MKGQVNKKLFYERELEKPPKYFENYYEGNKKFDIDSLIKQMKIFINDWEKIKHILENDDIPYDYIVAKFLQGVGTPYDKLTIYLKEFVLNLK